MQQSFYLFCWNQRRRIRDKYPIGLERVQLLQDVVDEQYIGSVVDDDLGFEYRRGHEGYHNAVGNAVNES